MKDRPILFTAENAQKVHDGVKAQIRRIVKFPYANPLGQWEPTTVGGPDGGKNWKGETMPETVAMWHTRTGDHVFCPHGVAGDRLWVREPYLLRGNGTMALYKGAIASVEAAGIGGMYGGWKNSMFMPKWACRTWLTITHIGVERLQDISYDDEGAEGVTVGPDCNDRHSGFIQLWETINGPGSWKLNPWVWVIEFVKVNS